MFESRQACVEISSVFSRFHASSYFTLVGDAGGPISHFNSPRPRSGGSEPFHPCPCDAAMAQVSRTSPPLCSCFCLPVIRKRRRNSPKLLCQVTRFCQTVQLPNVIRTTSVTVCTLKTITLVQQRRKRNTSYPWMILQIRILNPQRERKRKEKQVQLCEVFRQKCAHANS